MISKSCDFKEFLNSITDLDHAEIILLANAEATAAERLFYKQKARLTSETTAYQDYAIVLKGLIGFLRSSVKIPPSRDFNLDHLLPVKGAWRVQHRQDP